MVVAFENCSGLKSMLLTDEENPDVYDALARRYLGIGCSCMSPNPNRLAMLDKLIDEFHVDGVVDIILQACHTYNVETALVGKLVKEKKGIPYTVVETDYSQSDVGQIQTRAWPPSWRCCKAERRMKFDFTTIYDRGGKMAMAVDAVEKIPVFQPNEGFDAIPMWVADMNFATAPARDGGHPEAAGASSVRLLYDQR